MRKLLRWSLFNLTFAVLLVVGFVYEVPGARNVVYFFVGLVFLLSLGNALSPMIEAISRHPGWPAVPAWIDLTYDLSVIIFLAWFGCFISATLYFIQTLMVQYMYQEVAKVREARARIEPEPDPVLGDQGREYA